MKNIAVATLAILIIAFGSCQKKPYTCECTSIAGIQQFEIKKSSRHAARNKCESYTDHPEVDGPDCHLKN